MNGSEVIVKCLEKKGVTHIFGITGGAVIPLYDTLYDNKKIKVIMCRHEQGAAHMAAGYARASGKTSVCLATSGPGGTNLVTGIMDAYMDSTPMIAMAGQVPTSLVGGDAFQESDMIGITMPITKHNFQLRDPNKISDTMLKAFKITNTGRPGPVYIDLPKDVQTATVTAAIKDDVDIPSYKPVRKPNIKAIKNAVEMIFRSKKPLIIAGGGCIISGSQDELIELVNLTNIPVSTTTMGKGIFPENHPNSLGVTGMHGEEHANFAALKSDCIISIGCRFSDRITGDLGFFAKDAKVIHADVDPSEIGKNVKVDIPIVGDAKAVINMLTQIIGKISNKDKFQNSEWVKELKKIKEETHKIERQDMKGMTQANLLTLFNKFKDEDDIVVTGVGQHQMFGEHFLTFTKPRTWITSGGAGTMGYGLPAAIGAKVANPNKEIYDLDGDGSFQMTLQELATAKQYGIKVIVIIMNNGYLGMVRQWLELFKNKRYAGVDFESSNPDFVKIAEAYNLKGIRVNTPEEFINALKTAKQSKETIIIDTIVEKEENIFPMMPSGKGLDKIIHGKTIFKQTWDEVK